MIDDPLRWRFHGVGLGECGNAEFGDSWCVRSCGCDRDKYYFKAVKTGKYRIQGPKGRCTRWSIGHTL